MKRINALCLLRIFIVPTPLTLQSYQKTLDKSPDDSILPFKRLSVYSIYQGNPADLIPYSDYEPYELTPQLFNDYAEKQRLIKAQP